MRVLTIGLKISSFKLEFMQNILHVLRHGVSEETRSGRQTTVHTRFSIQLVHHVGNNVLAVKTQKMYLFSS